jgi:8-oxo-dGTP diphosphatase
VNPDPDPKHSPEIEVVGGVIVEAGRVLIARRRAGQTYALRWEFPGGKLEAGESPEEALDRELAEELGIRVRVVQEYGDARYADPAGRRYRIRFYLARRIEGEPAPLEVDAVEWAGADRLRVLDFTPADREVVERVRGDLAAGRL